MSKRSLFRVVTFLAGWLLLVATRAVAQVSEAEFLGTITDQGGGVLPGVTVTATHIDTGTTRSVVTKENGRYGLRGMRLGQYKVSAELHGFTTVERTGVTLLLGQSATLNLQMTIATVRETVTVAGEALVDTTHSGIAANLDLRQMQQLPLNGRDWMSMTLVAPGVRGGGGEQTFGVGIIPTFGGGSNFRTKVNVDGMQTNESTNFFSVNVNFSQEAVREVQVLSNRFSAEHAHASGGLLNAVTKSGTNTFTGSLYGFFRNDAFNAKDSFTGRVEPFKDNQVGATIGGPIKKDRLHFFLNWESERRPQTQTPSTGIPELQKSYPLDFTQDMGLLRLDYQMTPTHRLTARAAFTSANLLNESTTDHVSTGWGRPTDGQSYVLHSTWTLGQNALNEFKGQYIDFDRSRQANSQFPFLDFPGAKLGSSTGSVADKKEELLQLRNDFSWFTSSHSLKFGAEYFREGVGGRFQPAVYGSYLFGRNPTDWAAVIRVVEANDRVGLQELVNRGVVPPPANAVFGIGPGPYWVTVHVVGGYIQDDWKPTPRLTLNLGIRYDIEIDAGKVRIPSRFLSRPDQQPRGKTDRDNFAPRLGFVYALDEKQRTVLRGGAGRYYDQFFVNQGIQDQVYANGDTYAQPNILYNGAPDFMINPIKGITLQSLIENSVPTNINAMGKRIEVPYTDQYTVGVQRQLTDTLAVQADVVHNRARNEAYVRDINLFVDPETGEPRPVASFGRPDPRFGVIALNYFDARGRYDALQLSATKRFSKRYEYQASYILSWSYAANGDSFGGRTPEPTRPISELYGPSDRDQRHRFVVNATAQLPYDFHLGGVFFAASGTRFETRAGRDLNRDQRNDDLARYPDGRKWPRAGGLGDSVYRVDLRVSKRVKVHKSAAVEGIAEVFNLFDRSNYIRYNGNQSSAAFLQPQRSSNLQYQPRMGQLALRLTF